MGINVKQAKEEAIKEIEAESLAAAKAKIKAKYRELHAAQQVVKNIKRELEDLEDELSQG